MTTSRTTPFSNPQRGGITIVVALVLIVLMSLAAFSMSRNSIRELATSGSILQGGKATEAANAGLDWYVVWSQPDNAQAALSSSTATGNQNLAKAMRDLTTYGANWYGALSSDSLLASTSSSRNWDMAAAITSNESQTATNDMVFDNTAAGVVKQAGNNNGNPVVQRFDLFVRYLGVVQSSVSSTGNAASGGTAAGSSSPGERYYQVVSTGNAAVPVGNGSYLRYQQRREMITSAPPF